MKADAEVGGDAGHAESDQERWFLNDQRDFLLRSIDDAERERDAGDLEEKDYRVLMARDRARLAEVEAELAALGPVVRGEDVPAGPDGPARARRGKWRRVGIVASCLLIATGVIILVDHAVNPGLPGQALSGSITQSKAQLIEGQLAAAVLLNNQGKAVQALQLYNKVLSEDPDDPQALAASGWLEWNYGSAGHSAKLLRSGRLAEKKAIRLAPTYYAGHLFLGLILLNQDDNPAGAINEFTEFLSDDPPKAEVTRVASLVASAYREAGVPIPTALTTTTTTTSGS